MTASFFSADHYHWGLSLCVLAAALLVPKLFSYIALQVPAFKKVSAANSETAKKQYSKSFYGPVQKRSRLWNSGVLVITFGAILPFCLTTDSQSWWEMLLDIFTILMVYDFIYYLVHRFLFHDGGPLVWMHAIHHQNRNPCREDSSYLHPLESAIGLGLYAGTIALLALIMGAFNVVTIAVTWIAFTEINLHNHDRMEGENRFPFKYLNYASYMHRVHHSRFTSGNFATITLFYDWIFGTYDDGNGWGKNRSDPVNAEVTVK